MIDVLYEDNHLLVLNKPVNIPVQEDASKDRDVLTLAKEYLREKYQKPGNVYLGLVHRLDRPVGGIMVFAKTSKAAARLSESVRQNQIKKTYLAIIAGVPQEKQGTFIDYLQKDRKTNRSFTTDKKHGKYAELSYEVLAEKEGMSLVRIQLKTGRSHQIRVQFASRHLPLVNDQRYHPHPEKGQIALWASELSLIHPVKKEEMTFQCPPPKCAPWTLFKEVL